VIRPRPLILPSLTAVLDWHKQRYPLLRARDIYKLLHQGVFGPAHMVPSAAAARRALASELAALEVRSSKSEGRMPEPEFEPIDPRGELVRVNLRPLQKERREKREGRKGNRGKERRTDVDLLAMALVESVRRVKGNPEQMRRRLAASAGWCRRNMPRQAEELERLAAVARESGFPAFHHSSAYARAYRPAYRVVLKTCLPRFRVSGRVG
jgi:hypothetical protein